MDRGRDLRGSKGYGDYKDAAYGRMLAYRANADRKGISFELAEDDFYRLLTSPCHYSGLPPQKMITAHSGIF